MADGPHIGRLGERSLHAALKDWVALPGDVFEVEVDGYVIDVVRGDLLIEIQTGNFAAMKRKLARLTPNHRVRLLYPVAAEKWIVKLGPDGESQLDRRRSPARHGVLAVFRELVSFPHLVKHQNFAVHVVLTRQEEVRVNDGAGSWRRKGWSIADRRLLGVVDDVLLTSPADFRALLPRDLPDPFTTRDLADAYGERINLVGKMAYCLREMGAIETVGRKGRAYLYSLPAGG